MNWNESQLSTGKLLIKYLPNDLLELYQLSGKQLHETLFHRDDMIC